MMSLLTLLDEDKQWNTFDRTIVQKAVCQDWELANIFTQKKWSDYVFGYNVNQA